MTLRKQVVGTAALGVMLIGFGFCAPAQAAYTLTVQQAGNDVTATGVGSINFDALELFGDELDRHFLGKRRGNHRRTNDPTDDTFYMGITGHQPTLDLATNFLPTWVAAA